MQMPEGVAAKQFEKLMIVSSSISKFFGSSHKAPHPNITNNQLTAVGTSFSNDFAQALFALSVANITMHKFNRTINKSAVDNWVRNNVSYSSVCCGLLV